MTMTTRMCMASRATILHTSMRTTRTTITMTMM